MKSQQIRLLLISLCLYQLVLIVFLLDPWKLNWAPQPVTFLFYVLPRSIYEARWLSQILFGFFLVSAIGWIIRFWPRLSSGLCLLSYVTINSQILQNVHWEDHRAGLLTFFLGVLFASEFFDQEDEYLSPGLWKILMTGAVVFYFNAGLGKVLDSGLAWANGTSLQIWVIADTYRQSWLKDLILRSQLTAQLFQWGTLLIEISAPLALLSNVYRRYWAVGLIFFHLGIEIIFNYHYFTHGLIVLVLAFYPLAGSQVTKEKIKN